MSVTSVSREEEHFGNLCNQKQAGNEQDEFNVPGSEIPANQETTSCQLAVTGASTLVFALVVVDCCIALVANRTRWEGDGRDSRRRTR